MSCFFLCPTAQAFGVRMKRAIGVIHLILVLVFSPSLEGTSKPFSVQPCRICNSVVSGVLVSSACLQATASRGSPHSYNVVPLKKRRSLAGGNQAQMGAFPPPMPCITAKRSE